MSEPLAFYDSLRMEWSEEVRSWHLASQVGEYMIGDYGTDDEGTGEDGEFKILLYDFHGPGSVLGMHVEPLSVQVCVFDDGHGSFERARDMDLMTVLKLEYQHPWELGVALLRRGFVDRSRVPLPEQARRAAEVPAHHLRRR